MSPESTEAPSPVPGALMEWLSLPDITTALVVGVIGLVAGFAWAKAKNRFTQRESSRLKHFEQQLSKIRLGGPADRLEHILGEEALWEEMDLQASTFREKGHFRFYDLEYAFLKFAIRSGRIEAFSVRAKNGGLKFSIRGENKCQSLALGDKFGLCPDDQIFYSDISGGVRSNLYVECRPNVGETDPNIWLHGWHLQETIPADAWLNRPQWLERWHMKLPAKRELSTLSSSQREELASFRDRLEINVVGTMSRSEFAACGGMLSAYA